MVGYNVHQWFWRNTSVMRTSGDHIRCHYNLRPHEWCPADHMSVATLAIADTALEAPGHLQGDGRGGGEGQLSARLSPRSRARWRQHGAPDRDECDLTQVGNSGSHLYGHCAEAWLKEARRSWRIGTDERHPQARRRGPLGAHHLARCLVRGHARERLFGYSFLRLQAIGPSGSSRRCSAATEWPGGL